MSAPPVKLADVEWRVDSKPRDGQARFVPYVDAATTARLLDEWVGPENWSDRYEVANLGGKESLWCHLSVRLNDDWVTKTDVGVPSNMEGQKGMVSDAFKRAACLKWGVARNVYELPTMWAPCREDARGNAWPNDQTLPTILRKLKAQGFTDAEGGRVQEEAPEAEPEVTARRAAPPARPAAPDQRPGVSTCAACGDALAGQPVVKRDGVYLHRDCVTVGGTADTSAAEEMAGVAPGEGLL